MREILQIAVFSVFFASALAMLPESKRSPLLPILQSLADTMFQLTRIVMWLAPIAGTRIVVPYRLSLQTPLGQGVLEATQFITVASPPRMMPPATAAR